MSRVTARLAVVSWVLLVAAVPQGFAASPQELFDQRILPIFRSPEPSSCVQCHLASVDLKHYILPSPEKTFASLRAQGLVDLAQPSRSKILNLIRMGDRDADPGARLIMKSCDRPNTMPLPLGLKPAARTSGCVICPCQQPTNVRVRINRMP